MDIERLAFGSVTAVERVPAGRHLELLVVDSGQYRWSALDLPGEFGKVRFRILRDDSWTFRVQSGRINYAGRIIVRRDRRLRVGPTQLHGRNVNRSAMAWVDLRKRFPQVLDRYPIAYSGHSRDEFLERLAAALGSGRDRGAPEAPE